MCAEYLFQEDKQYYDVRFDTGDKVIQCGRHNDIFKLWLLWRAKGMDGFDAHINHLMEMSEYLVAELKKRPDKFELLWPEPECVNVCFWYVPKRLRGKPKDKAWRAALGKVRVRKRKETRQVFFLPITSHN
jgi:glutamate decarboxylase